AGGKASCTRAGMRAAPAAPPRPADSAIVAASNGKRDFGCAALTGAGLGGGFGNGFVARFVSTRPKRERGGGVPNCAAGGGLVSGAIDSALVPSWRAISICGPALGTSPGAAISGTPVASAASLGVAASLAAVAALAAVIAGPDWLVGSRMSLRSAMAG